MRWASGRRERGRPEQPGRNPQPFLFVRVLDGSDQGNQTETNREPRSGSLRCGISDCRASDWESDPSHRAFAWIAAVTRTGMGNGLIAVVSEPQAVMPLSVILFTLRIPRPVAGLAERRAPAVCPLVN